MSKNYDNNKPYTNIYELLPSVFQSDVNKSLSENMFNKFFTKNELSNIVGTITSGSNDSTQIVEPNSHRQHNQLQPLLTTTVATQQYISSFKDLMNEASRIGIDVSKFDQWGSTTQHNFIPPVDLDKLINYGEYFWIDDSIPEYITIKNRYNQLNGVVQQGYNDNSELRALISSYYATDSQDIRRDIARAIDLIYPNFYKYVDEIRFIDESKPSNRVYTSGWDWYKDSAQSKWDFVNNVSGDWDNPIDGISIVETSQNTIVVNDDWSILLNEMDMIYVNENTIVHVVSATYNTITQQTTITTVEDVSGLQGLLTISNYDSNVFDDADIVSEWDKDFITQSEYVQNLFNFTLQTDDWSKNNHWVHILDLPSEENATKYVRAVMPIIEYDSLIQLNNWSYKVYNWAYRSKNVGTYLKTSFKPSVNEIFAHQRSMAVVDILSTNTFSVASVNTQFYYSGVGITITDGQQFYYFNIISTSSTTITVDGILPQLFDDMLVYPVRRTSVGDDWIGFTDQWIYLSNNSIPCEPQPTIDYSTQLSNSVQFDGIGQFTHWYKLGIELDDYTQVRVYLNGIRTYGTYTLGWFDGNEYTLGSVSGKINAIWFIDPILSGSIKVEYKSLALSDALFESVQVNTPHGIINTSLVEYEFNEQQRTQPNQYPMFDMFKLDGTPARKASPLWTFEYLDTADVNPNIGYRIRKNNTLYYYDQKLVEDGISYAYKEIVDQQLVLRSIWKTDSTNINYVPKFVNAKGQEVDKDDPSGDWEIPKQMLCNLQHSNRKFFSGADLSEHFHSILSSQPSTTWLSTTNRNQWRLLVNPYYGAGGTIKEMGGSFDTFLSSLYVTDVTVLDILRFAKIQYNLNIVKMRQALLQSFERSVSTLASDDLTNILRVIVNNSITTYVTNNSNISAFSDTTMYNTETKVGMPYWCITLPKLGLIPKRVPKLLIDDSLGIHELTHHDGHTTTPLIPTELKSTLIQQLVKNPLTTVGVLSSIPTAENSIAGMIYYASDANRLFKNLISHIGPQDNGLLDGAIWLNTNDSIVYIKNGNISVPYGNNIWVELNIDKVYGQVLFAVEQRLYDVCDYNVKYNISNPLSSMEPYFTLWTRENNIANPFSSVYKSTNAFSWNYKLVNLSDYRIANVPSEWNVQNPPCTWYSIYELVYGTRYPHLEPWKLQKYSEEPYWWKAMYQSTTTDRKWNPIMWNNIRNGIIPSNVMTYLNVQGTGLANQVPGYDVISVNTTNAASSDNLYQIDDLLPPYYNSSLLQDGDIVASGSLLTSLPNQRNCALPYAFGDKGPYEDMWLNSSDKLYDQAIDYYLDSPIQFTQKTMGYELYDVGGLLVDTTNDNIPSHSSIVFHGELINGKPLLVNGLNQLYINYLRYNSKDLHLSEFKQKWKGWIPRLGYQFSNFVDVDSVAVISESSALDGSDFVVVPKKTPSISTAELTSLNVVVNEVGQSIFNNGLRIPLGLGSDWKFRINCPTINIKTIKLYGVDTTAQPQTFNILDSSHTTNVFFHYPINKQVVHTFIPGSTISTMDDDFLGIQGLVNFIDGYVAYLQDKGFNFDSSEHNTIDALTGRTLNWQTEIEKLIDQIYVGMVSDQVPIHFIGKWSYVTLQNDTFTTIGSGVKFENGDLVQVHSSIALPSAFKSYELYEVANATNTTFKLASTDTGNIITSSDVGKGVLSVGMYFTETETPSAFYEVNPFKHNIVVEHPIGILADVNKGSFNLASNQGLFDQYGRNIPTDHYRVFRGDKSSYIDIVPGIVNDFIVGADDIHIGGASLSIDGYEHTLLLNSQLLSGASVYDDFLGLRIKKLTISTRTQLEKTFRPSVGGRYYKSGQQYENIEASAENLQLMYDTNLAEEDSPIIQAGRKLLGFEKMDYLSEIGLTDKTQFLFYKAMIQQKGATSAINAFINLKRFIDAQVDEYWAYRVGSFGDAGKLNHPQLTLKSVDSVDDNLMLQFISLDDIKPNSDFTQIEQSDSRWINLPEITRNYPNNMYFEAKVLFEQQLDYNNITKYIKLQQPCSDIVVKAIMPQSRYQFVVEVASQFSVNFSLSTPYIMNAKCISCVVLRGNEEITVKIEEIDNHTIRLYDWTIFGNLTNPMMGDVVNILIQDATLKVDTHYYRVNSNTICFDKANAPSHDIAPATSIAIYGFGPNIGAISPIKLIDSNAQVSISNIIIWDPIHNQFNPMVEQIIDWKGSDPAKYNSSPFNNDTSFNKDISWLDSMVGQVWLDTELIRYKPYWDNVLNPNFVERVELWGILQDWCSVTMYEWVKSPVHPSEYASYVATQSKLGNYISGDVRTVLKRRIRNSLGMFDNNWIEQKTIVIDCNLLTDGYYYMVPDDIDQDTEAKVFVNGQLTNTVKVSNHMISLVPCNLNPVNHITVVIPITVPTAEQLKFDPDVKDDISINVQYKYDYKYSYTTTIDSNGIDSTNTYYFWVSNTSTNHNNMTLIGAEKQYVKPQLPFFIPDNFITSGGMFRFTRCAIRGLLGKVSSENRFMLRFVNNQTLRDIIPKDGILKTKHEQWRLFRERQSNKIDVFLWNKLIESCSGRSLKDGSPIPSYDRVLYDSIEGTTYRYGLLPDQAIADSTAINIIKDCINDINYDLYPIERDVFWSEYNLDDVDNIELTLQHIYATFSTSTVNRIWFTVLHDTLSKTRTFEGIMKTSWVQLDSIQILDTTGDDA